MNQFERAIQGEVDLEAVSRLGRDIKQAASILSTTEARFLVDAYYTMQLNRLRADSQLRSMTKSEEPNGVLAWLGNQNHTLERQVHGALQRYAENHTIGKWLLSLTGIGPVITAGLLAHIDITRAPTAGHIWRYAGLDPTSKWEKGQKRPWNASLKTLQYKAGESFVKTQNKENDIYGKFFVKRKAEEWSRNMNGDFAEQAAAMLVAKRIGKETVAYAFYAGHVPVGYIQGLFADGNPVPPVLPKTIVEEGAGVPMLPPAHIHSRARRYAVKLFLSHLQEVWFFDHYQKLAPAPYVFVHQQGHTHYIAPPNMHLIPGMLEARKTRGDILDQ